MSLYAIKDKDGKLRDATGRGLNTDYSFDAFMRRGDAEMDRRASYPGGSVVELVEKAEPVEVSKAAGRELTDLREELAHGYTANSADYYVDILKCQHDMSTEDIFRALDVGWTVKQPQRWYVKTPKEWDSASGRQRFYKRSDSSIGQALESLAENTADEQFTAEEIDKYQLGGFETVEVED